MSNIEHYFENLLYHGEDCNGEPTQEVQRMGCQQKHL